MDRIIPQICTASVLSEHTICMQLFCIYNCNIFALNRFMLQIIIFKLIFTDMNKTNKCFLTFQFNYNAVNFLFDIARFKSKINVLKQKML